MSLKHSIEEFASKLTNFFLCTMSPHVSSYIITAARAGPSAKPTNSDNPAGIVFETYPFQESCLLIWDLYKS